MQGYYSLIQYCPDWTRLEVCNIGILLFCSQQQYLDVKMTPQNKRINTIFGKNHHLEYIKMFKNSFANRIRAERENIRDLNDLKMFIARRANNFIITEPRSTLVTNPEQDLNSLFIEVFGETSEPIKKNKSTIKQEFFKALEQKLGNEIDNRIIRDLPEIEVPIPGVRRTIRPCLGFMNGMFNIVLNEKLTPEDSFRKMSYATVIGKFLFDNENRHWGKQCLLILADTADNHEVKQQVDAFRPVMRDHHSEIFTDSVLFATKVSEEAKSLNGIIGKIKLVRKSF
jgi:hypothetical protein